MNFTLSTHLSKPLVPVIGLFVLILICCGPELAWAWSEPEYSHGPIIPISALLLFVWLTAPLKAREPSKSSRVTSMTGILIGLFGIVLSSVLDEPLVVFAFLGVALVSIIHLFYDICEEPKLFLIPVILLLSCPLPSAVQYTISSFMMLCSVKLSAAIISFVGIPVYVDNSMIVGTSVLDLGVVRISVNANASGFTYLFPAFLSSLTIVVIWNRGFIHYLTLLTLTFPVVVLFNSARISIASIVASEVGLASMDRRLMLDGHVSFLALTITLFLITWALNSLSGNGPRIAKDLNVNYWQTRLLASSDAGRVQGQQTTVTILILAAVLAAAGITHFR